MSMQRVLRRLKKKGIVDPVIDVKRIISHMSTTQFAPYVDKKEAKTRYVDTQDI